MAIIDLKMVSRELLGLADLSEAQIFCIYKTTKIVVIYKDKQHVLVTFQVVVPCLESFGNS